MIIIYCNLNIFWFILWFSKREKILKERFQFVQYSLNSIFGFWCIGASFSAAHSNKTSVFNLFNLFNLLLWIIVKKLMQITNSLTTNKLLELANYLTNSFVFWNMFQCANETSKRTHFRIFNEIWSANSISVERNHTSNYYYKFLASAGSQSINKTEMVIYYLVT